MFFKELPKTQEDGTPIEFRNIEWFPSYRIGSDGSVWSRQPIFRNRYLGWRKLSPTKHKVGYLSVTLQLPGGKAPRGKGQKIYVHRLVLMAFVGPCPAGMVACHHDGNRKNNNLTNLRWDTQRGNMADAIRHGTIPRGSDRPNSTLTERDVPIIRLLLGHGLAVDRIAALFQVVRETIRDIKDGRTWTHA